MASPDTSWKRRLLIPIILSIIGGGVALAVAILQIDAFITHPALSPARQGVSDLVSFHGNRTVEHVPELFLDVPRKELWVFALDRNGTESNIVAGQYNVSSGIKLIKLWPDLIQTIPSLQVARPSGTSGLLFVAHDKPRHRFIVCLAGRGRWALASINLAGSQPSFTFHSQRKSISVPHAYLDGLKAFNDRLYILTSHGSSSGYSTGPVYSCLLSELESCLKNNMDNKTALPALPPPGGASGGLEFGTRQRNRFLFEGDGGALYEFGQSYPPGTTEDKPSAVFGLIAANGNATSSQPAAFYTWYPNIAGAECQSAIGSLTPAASCDVRLASVFPSPRTGRVLMFRSVQSDDSQAILNGTLDVVPTKRVFGQARVASSPTGYAVAYDSKAHYTYFFQHNSAYISWLPPGDTRMPVLFYNNEFLPDNGSVRYDVQAGAFLESDKQVFLLISPEPQSNAFGTTIYLGSVAVGATVSQPSFISWIVAFIVAASVVFGVASSLASAGPSKATEAVKGLPHGVNVHNVTHVLVSMIVYVQLAAVSFSPSIPWSGSIGRVVQSVFNMSQVDLAWLFPGQSSAVNLYHIMFTVFALVFVATVLAVRAGAKCHGVVWFVPMCSSWLFIPISRGLLILLSCTVLKGDGKSIGFVLSAVDNMECFPIFTGSYNTAVQYMVAVAQVVSILIIPAFFTLALSTKPLWQELRHEKNDFYYAPRFLILQQEFKLCMVAVSTFLTSYEEVYLGSLVLLSCVLAVYVLATRPCVVRSANTWHAVGLSAVGWSGVGALLTVLLPSDVQEYIAPATLGGWGLLLLIRLLPPMVSCCRVVFCPGGRGKGEEGDGRSTRIRQLLKGEEAPESSVPV